ncbi:MAG TPA: NlpC/P60 family protein [Mycobacteriales bacterium]|nr:NlpC/P60 family protein [Mycobacteriales bacterium]
MVSAAAIPAAASHGSHHRAAAPAAAASSSQAPEYRAAHAEAAEDRARVAQQKRAQIRWRVAHSAAAKQRYALMHPSVSRVNLPAMYKSLHTLKRQAHGSLPYGARVAVAWAYHELGRPYSYGSAGPYAFDCSGLTRYVWGKAGVSLAHYSGAQLSEGTRIRSRGNARPGDILEFAGMGHVALYVGDGWMIEASHSGTPVWRVPVPWQRIIGITRPRG